MWKVYQEWRNGGEECVKKGRKTTTDTTDTKGNQIDTKLRSGKEKHTLQEWRNGGEENVKVRVKKNTTTDTK